MFRAGDIVVCGGGLGLYAMGVNEPGGKYKQEQFLVWTYRAIK